MKTLSGVKATVTGNRVTITADIVEKDFSQFPVQQQTIVHVAKGNAMHHRHLHISQAGVIVRTPGKEVGFVIEKQTLIDLATQIEPRISYAPVARIGNDLTVKIASELTPDLQWEHSEDHGKTWKHVEGQTTATLDRSKVKCGNHVRLKASSEAGEMISNSTIV